MDDEGYRVNLDDWDKEVTCALADREGISKDCPLTGERIDILKFMREYYKKFEAFPVVRYVCENVHQKQDC